MKKMILVGMLIFAFFVSACASVDSPTYKEDPLEPLNRATSEFNQVVDTFIMTPLVYVYKTVTPPILQIIIENVTSNLREPISTINYLLQGEGEKAGMSLGRFMTNSILGVGGVMDVASRVGVPNDKTNFGTTLAKWGATESPYFVIPFIGPSTIRDGIGMAVGLLVHPSSLAAHFSENEALVWFDWSRFGLEILNTRAKNLLLTDDIKRNAIDPYVMMRTMFLQNRNHELEQAFGKPVSGENVSKDGYDFDMDID